VNSVDVNVEPGSFETGDCVLKWVGRCVCVHRMDVFDRKEIHRKVKQSLVSLGVIEDVRWGDDTKYFIDQVMVAQNLKSVKTLWESSKALCKGEGLMFDLRSVDKTMSDNLKKSPPILIVSKVYENPGFDRVIFKISINNQIYCLKVVSMRNLKLESQFITESEDEIQHFKKISNSNVEEYFPKAFAYGRLWATNEKGSQNWEIIIMEMFNTPLDNYFPKNLSDYNTFFKVIKLLETIHKKKWVHGDVKPGNMVFKDELKQEIKFVDVLSVSSVDQDSIAVQKLRYLLDLNKFIFSYLFEFYGHPDARFSYELLHERLVNIKKTRVASEKRRFFCWDSLLLKSTLLQTNLWHPSNMVLLHNAVQESLPGMENVDVESLYKLLQSPRYIAHFLDFLINVCKNASTRSMQVYQNEIFLMPAEFMSENYGNKEDQSYNNDEESSMNPQTNHPSGGGSTSSANPQVISPPPVAPPPVKPTQPAPPIPIDNVQNIPSNVLLTGVPLPQKPIMWNLTIRDQLDFYRNIYYYPMFITVQWNGMNIQLSILKNPKGEFVVDGHGMIIYTGIDLYGRSVFYHPITTKITTDFESLFRNF